MEKEEHEFIGSYSTGSIEHDENIFSRPIPNVLGLVRIKKVKGSESAKNQN